jgi:hypothetical protein
VRLAYVAATRARDLLVVPAIGDGPEDRQWVAPLAPAIYGGDAVSAAGLPRFVGKDTHLDRPPSNMPTLHTMRPGAYQHVDPTTGAPYTVVWWDPLLLDRPGAERRGIRHEHLIGKDAPPEVVAADRRRYDDWRAWRRDAIDRASAPSLRVMTVTEWADASLDGSVSLSSGMAETAARVEVVDGGVAEPARPSGVRFGTLVHALLAHVPLDAGASAIAGMAAVQARMLNASDDERAAAASIAARALAHALYERARAARGAGRACRRELPLSVVVDGIVVDGQADLAFDDGDRWIVVDVKTDVEIAGAEPSYRRQVALYADAIARAYGRPAQGVLLRV